MKKVRAMLLIAILAIGAVATKQAIGGFAGIIAAHTETIDRVSSQ